MKRALLIGIDAYKTFPKLTGCVNDANALFPLFAKNADNSPNFGCTSLLTSRGPVNRKDVIAAINTTLGSHCDVALIYFAGHGIAMDNDVCLATSDGDTLEPGVPLSMILGKAQRSKVEQVIVILDCCHAGGGGGSAMLGGNVSLIRDGLAVLAAANQDEIAKETPNGRGQFSYYLGGALDGGAADARGWVSLAGVYAYMAECFGAWDQRPTFKANLDESFGLRRTKPHVTDEHLRKLTEIFPTMTSERRLNPTYERESKTRKPANVAIYDVLTQYRNARLIEFIGADYLYHAAMKSKSCRLTPHGQHYWQLADKGLL